MTRRAPIAACAVLVAGAACAGASAHVTVTPRSAAQGTVARLTFRVPNERADAGTTRVEVFFPPGTPVGTVHAELHAGWTDEAKLSGSGSVAQLNWAAATTGAEIQGRNAARFTLSAGPLPKVDRLVLKVLQYYSDGSVVRWIQDSAPGEDPPERPAPTVELTAVGATPATATRHYDVGAVWPWVFAAAGLWLVAGVGAFLVIRRRRR